MRFAFLFAFAFSSLWGTAQTYLSFKVGVHKSSFDGMTEAVDGYISQARPLYANIDSQLYKGQILKKYGPELGMDFSAGLSQKISKRINVGIALGFRIFKNVQFRYTGKSENYPYEVLPAGKNTYETYTFRDQFITLTPSIQWKINKHLALELAPDFWKRESARYNEELSFIGTSEFGGITITSSNPDSRDYGAILNASLIFNPDQLFSFAIEHSRFITAVNKETQLERNFYTSWNAKLIMNIKLKKK